MRIRATSGEREREKERERSMKRFEEISGEIRDRNGNYGIVRGKQESIDVGRFVSDNRIVRCNFADFVEFLDYLG